ncbi:MAG: hypothetical protein U0441_32045 [Polyangiaceae bacterium]
MTLTLTACGGSVASGSGGTTTDTTTSGTGAGGAGGATGTGGSTGGVTATGGSTTTTTPIDKAAACTDTFGDQLTNAFGRLDGTVLAVLKPTDLQCPMPNSDHVIIEVVMNGAAYRMVVNVLSTQGNPDVDYLAIDHALPGPAWAEGWHPGLALDYVADMGVKSTDFTAIPMTQLSDMVVDEIPLDEKISVYASSSGGASAHKVHRNDGKIDGAIILHPGEANSRALLFHFQDQTF